MDQLRHWYTSDDRAEALALRNSALSRRLPFAEGVADQTATSGTGDR